jgi:hypothetical protein
VELQQKLQAGKGPGYERWAKVFNLKQMAKTLAYLESSKITEYRVLEKKAREVSDQYLEQAQRTSVIKERISEIVDMKKHINNYARTRDAFLAYRKSNFSEVFADDHHAELAIYQAACDEFKRFPYKELPKHKDLNQENNQLSSCLKQLQMEHKRTQVSMREICTVKLNVDILMKYERTEKVRKPTLVYHNDRQRE